MKNKKENIIIVLLIILLELVSIFFVRPKTFVKIKSILSFFIINFIFIVSLFLIFKIIIYIYKKIRNKDLFYINFIKYTIIYAIILFLFLIIIYPGYWLYDELWIIIYVKNYMLAGWQSYISVILYTMSLYIIPNPVGIEIFQIIIISAIMGYVQTRIKYLFNKKIYNLILQLIFITPVFLINNLYLLRSSLYAYLVLFFYCIIICDYIEKNKMTKKKFILLLIVTFFMINWRSEGIVFLFCNIFCILFTYKETRNLKKISIIVLAILTPMITYSRICSDKAYGATTTVLPLSIMLNEKLDGKNIKQDINNIDKVFNVMKLKEYPNYHYIEAYWDGNIKRKNLYDNINVKFYKSFFDIVINNFNKFLKVRFKVFKYTFLNIEYPNNCYRAYLNNYELPYPAKAIVKEVVPHYKMYPINKNLKISVESLLVENTAMMYIFWTGVSIIIFIGLFGIMILCLFRKNWLLLVMICSLFMKMVITFFTSTASYFMYYFTEYTVGIFIIFIYLSLTYTKKKRKKEK